MYHRARHGRIDGKMYSRVKVATVVTDDNMVIEWEQPLRYPEPERP